MRAGLRNRKFNYHGLINLSISPLHIRLINNLSCDWFGFLSPAVGEGPDDGLLHCALELLCCHIIKLYTARRKDFQLCSHLFTLGGREEGEGGRGREEGEGGKEGGEREGGKGGRGGRERKKEGEEGGREGSERG